MLGSPRGQRCCLYRVRIGDLCPGPPSAGSLRVAHDGDSRSSGRTVCLHRGWPAELVAHPAARRGERDPQRIADDHQEQRDLRWQAHGHRAIRPVTVTGNGHWPGSGAPADPPHHIPVRWLPGHEDHRGENDCQRPHGQGDSRLGSRPCMPHPVRIRLRLYRFITFSQLYIGSAA